MDKDQEKFILWLKKQGLGDESSRDVISRCRRVEKFLEITLSQELKSEGKYTRIIEKLKKNPRGYLKPNVKTLYAVPVICRAVTLYHQFIISK